MNNVLRMFCAALTVGVTAVAGPGATDGSAWTRSVHGLCGQLVLSAPSEDDALWLTGLAP